jgi:NADH:ubiquinone reductase (H+-translocating)
MRLAVHLHYLVGSSSRVTTVLHRLLGFVGTGRAQRVAAQQQVYGRPAHPDPQ